MQRYAGKQRRRWGGIWGEARWRVGGLITYPQQIDLAATDSATRPLSHILPHIVGWKSPIADPDERGFPGVLRTLTDAADGNLAEREGFEPSIRFCRILTFQASAFDHSATAPHFAGRALI